MCPATEAAAGGSSFAAWSPASLNCYRPGCTHRAGYHLALQGFSPSAPAMVARLFVGELVCDEHVDEVAVGELLTDMRWLALCAAASSNRRPAPSRDLTTVWAEPLPPQTFREFDR